MFATITRQPSRPGRAVRVACALASLVLVCATALGQLTEEDIQKLRERGRIEGWTFTVDLNGATDYPLDQLCGTVVPADWEKDYAEHVGSLGYPTRDLPDAFDWRDTNGVTPIRNQGGCGSCWAFSAIGVVEASVLINDGVSTNLSEQWLVSCTAAGSCNGGWPSAAMGYMRPNDRWLDPCGDWGAVRESDFPYVAYDAACGCPYQHPYWFDDWHYVPGDQWSIDNLKQAIYDYGPISVTVAVDSAFQGYSGGVFNACWNGTINHAVVLVGWDDNQGSNGVWIMRNSWGTWWGESGYMRIEYGCSKIGSNALYAVYRYDCNANGVRDDYDIANCDGSPWCGDCDGNGVPDECDIAGGDQFDCNGDGIPDSCEFAGLDHVYVDPAATGANTGTSWADALTSLDTAWCIADSEPGVTEIWLHAGTYTPGPAGDRTATFQLHDGITLRGSFGGTETSPDQRDLADPANRTIFSGDLAGDDLPGGANRDDNAYHVVTCSTVGSQTVLDAITIADGNADGAEMDRFGAGLLNLGGSPMLTNCTFLGNHAGLSGGGVYNYRGDYGGGTPTFVNCVFSGNQAGAAGGAACTEDSVLGDMSPAFINCTFAGNAAILTGGIYAIGPCPVTLANCIVYGNTDENGAGQSAQIDASVLTLDHNCIQGLSGGLGGAGNIDAEPRFVDSAGPDGVAGTLDDDLHIQPCSPCTDAGNNAALPPEITTDLDGQPRFVDDPVVPDTGTGGPPIVDMGAYEFAGDHPGDLDGDGDVDLSDLSILLAHYGETGGMTYADGDFDGDGDVDLADLSFMLAVYGSDCP